MTERTLEDPASPSYEQALAYQAELEKETEALAARPRYAEPVGWLRCFRGLDTLSAKILVAGIVDFRRFRRPRELIAYVGLEYSSRDAEPRGAITKTGNTHVRRALVEAAWHYRHRPTVGRALAARSQGQPAGCLTHAWRVQQRLRRYRHLVGHGKRPPVAVTAIARDLVGFIWAAMTRRPPSPRSWTGHVDSEWRRARAEAGTSGESSGSLCGVRPLHSADSRSQSEAAPGESRYAALPSATRGYQPDSSSKPLDWKGSGRRPQETTHRQSGTGAVTKSLDGRSFHVSLLSVAPAPFSSTGRRA